jgi:rare lipoprotein A
VLTGGGVEAEGGRSRRRGRATTLLLGLAIWGCTAVRPPFPAPEPTGTYVAGEAGEEGGLASWYGAFHHGLPTASGELFDMTEMTAAHRTLPLGTRLRVTNLENGRMVRVRVNDRGPYVAGRVLDLSHGAAQRLDMVERGVVPVRFHVVEP